jgi:hypothetical protein
MDPSKDCTADDADGPCGAGRSEANAAQQTARARALLRIVIQRADGRFARA